LQFPFYSFLFTGVPACRLKTNCAWLFRAMMERYGRGSGNSLMGCIKRGTPAKVCF
jgi:hypothetical protein